MYERLVREAAVARLAQGGSVSSVSRELGISRAAVRDWRDRGVAPAVATAPCFVCESRAPEQPEAYAALFGYYLGDGCLSRVRHSISLRISCDAAYPRIVTAVVAAISAVRPSGRVGRVRAPGVVVVQSYWKHWPCLFPQHGPGRKHERSLVLEPWQRGVVEGHPEAFLRGLFHSDGCRTHNWATRVVAGERKRYDYPRWQFVNNSKDIRGWCCESLERIGVPWRQSGWKTISVSTRAGVAVLDAVLGPKA